MTALMMAPTTGTVWGWLIVACGAVGVVAVACCVTALWDTVLYHHRKRVAFDLDIERQRALAFGYCQIVDVDGIPIRIQSDRAMDDTDRAAVDLVVRLLRDRLTELMTGLSS